MINHTDDALLKDTDAAALLSITPGTLRQWRVQGKGPKHIRIGERLVRYKRDTVLQWLHTRPELASTAE